MTATRRACKVNLDRLFDLPELKMAAQVEPIDVIDSSLAKAQEGNAVCGDKSTEGALPIEAEGHITVEPCNEKVLVNETTNENHRSSRRMVKVPPKLTNYRKKLSGQCPGCRIFVNDGDQGVVCEQCNAYWHYQCAKVTQVEIDTVWKDEFACEAHRASLKPVTKVTDADGETLQSVTIKINPYSLDKLNKVKFKLNHIDGEMESSPKACKRQHTVKVNSVTYQIIINNLTNFGHLLGDLEIKRADTDEVGENVQIQYYLSINGSVPVSVTCFHTTNNILIQLRSNKKTKIKSNPNIEENQKRLHQFVNGKFSSLIRHIEASAMYQAMKTELKSTLDAVRERLEQGCHDCDVNQVLDAQKSIADEVYATPRGENFDTPGKGGNSTQKQVGFPSTPSKILTPKKKGKQCNDECENTRVGLKTRISSLEKEKLSLKQKLETTEKHQESLRSTISSKEGLISTQAQVMAEQTKTISNQKKLIADHELQSKTHSEFASSFLEIMVSEGHNVEDTEMSIDGSKILKQMHEKVKKLEGQVLTYQEKLEEEGKMREDFRKKMDDVTQKLSTKSKEFNALKNQLATMENTVLTREKEIRASQDDAANMQHKNESLSIENARLKTVLSETDKKNEDLLETVENLKLAVPEPCVIMEQLLEKNKDKDKEIEELKENIDFTEKSLGEQLTSKIKEKEHEAQQLKETLETTQKSLEESKTLLKKETTMARQAHGLLKKEQERRLFFQEESSSLSMKLAEANVQLERKRILMNTSADESGEKAANEGDESLGVDNEKNSRTVESIGFQSTTAEIFPCIFELRKTGSCKREDKCKFDHELSQGVQTNSEEVTKLLVQTSSRIGRCAFEMTERGSCPGQPICTISHEKPTKAVNRTEYQPERPVGGC